jgi:hypothetical protein
LQFKNILIGSFFLFFISLIMITVVENKIVVFSFTIFVLLFSCLLLFLSGVRKKSELSSFITFFSVGLFWIAVSSFFRIYLFDYSQNTSDAYFFYQKSIDFKSKESINELIILTEGSLAVYFWRLIYSLTSFFGFASTPFYGIIFNNLILSFTAIIGVKISNIIFNNDMERAKRFILYFCSCGIFWLAASVHMRDAFIIFLTTILFYFAIKQINNNTTKNKLVFFGIVIFFTVLFPFLRTEFYFIPAFIFFCTFLPSLFLQRHKFIRYIPFLLLFIFLIVVISNLGLFDFNLLEVLNRGKRGYQEEIDVTANAGSLGVKLVIDQHPLVRLLIGSLYLQIYPIPFWYGFKTDTIYDFFKSINLFFLWGILASIYVCLKEISFYTLEVKKYLFFSLFIYLLMVFAISMSSLETRHLGCFFVPIIIIACAPDYTKKINVKRFKIAIFNILLFILLVHVSWGILKLI